MMSLLAWLFYNASASGVVSLLELYERFPTYDLLNYAAYNATFAAASSILLKGFRPDKEWREKAYQFCVLSGNQSCYFLVSKITQTSTTPQGYKFTAY